MESSAFIIKVSYGGVLRRFRVPVKANGLLDLHMAGLREKIAALFTLPVNAEFSLTYSDEDGDVVALVDDNDLFDVTNQRLKFLKISVQLNNAMPPESNGGSSANAGRPNSQNRVSQIQKSINDFLMAVPNPRYTISKVYTDFASSSSPLVGELLDCISKLGKLSTPLESSPCSPVTKTFCGEGSKPDSSGLSLILEVPFAGEKNDVSERTKAARSNGSADSKTSVHVPTSSGLGASFKECRFSGSTVNEHSPNPTSLNKTYPRLMRTHPRFLGTQLQDSWRKHVRACHTKNSSNVDYWTSFDVFHKGIYCDGCGIVPISGPRFMSKVKEDYDLCTSCFSVMGNDGDYTRMDKPLSDDHMHPFRGQITQYTNPWLCYTVPQPPNGGFDFRCTQPKLDCLFVEDVNVPDETFVAPSTPFTKIWKVMNNGPLVWPHGTQIRWIGGDKFSNSLAVDLQIPEEGLPINSELDIKVDFVAPESPGRYMSHWRMASSDGAKFGQRFWVLINVNPSLKGSVVDKFHGLDLNAFPDENHSRDFTGNNTTHESVPVLEAHGLDLNASPGEAHPAISPSSSSSSYNVIEHPNMPTAEALYVDCSSTMDILEEDMEKNDVEKTLLKELEEMGFMEIDLNKEILRENEYNLEQSVDALCGVSEWDPLLEDLQDMGFCDEVTNKRLLKKNNGSIEGVLMDFYSRREMES